MHRETTLEARNFVYPIFIHAGTANEPIAAMPDWSVHKNIFSFRRGVGVLFLYFYVSLFLYTGILRSLLLVLAPILFAGPHPFD